MKKEAKQLICASICFCLGLAGGCRSKIAFVFNLLTSGESRQEPVWRPPNAGFCGPRPPKIQQQLKARLFEV